MLCLPAGMDHYEEMLFGAHYMDQHFLNTPLEQNVRLSVSYLSVYSHSNVQRFKCAIHLFSYYHQHGSFIE